MFDWLRRLFGAPLSSGFGMLRIEAGHLPQEDIIAMARGAEAEVKGSAVSAEVQQSAIAGSKAALQDQNDFAGLAAAIREYLSKAALSSCVLGSDRGARAATRSARVRAPRPSCLSVGLAELGPGPYERFVPGAHCATCTRRRRRSRGAAARRAAAAGGAARWARRLRGGQGLGCRHRFGCGFATGCRHRMGCGHHIGGRHPTGRHRVAATAGVAATPWAAPTHGLPAS